MKMKRDQTQKYIIILFMVISISLSIFACESFKNNNQERKVVETIRIVTTTEDYDPIRYQSAYLIAQWWTELGLTVIVEPMEFRDLLTRIQDVQPETKDWEAFMLLWTGRVERADPDMFIYSISHSSQAIAKGNNISAYKSDTYDELAEAQRRISDPELRRTVVHAAQEVLAQEIPYVTLFYRYIHSAYRNDLIQAFSPMAGEGLFHEWLPYEVKPLNTQEDFYVSLASNQEPASLNPLTANSVWEWKILRLMYDKLARVNHSFRPEVWAAKSIEYLSDEVIEVTLRSDLLFHDGVPVTAADVKFSFDFMLDQEVSYFNAFLKPIKDITIEGDYKIIFTLNEPYAPFLTMTLSQIPILPQHLWQAWAKDQTLDIPLVGSGPMVFNKWTFGKSIELDTFTEHFSSNSIDIAGIHYDIFTSLEAVVEALALGESHISAAYLNPENLTQARKETTITLLESPDIGFYIFGFNCLKKPFDHQPLREAATRAMDLDYLVKELIDGYGDVGGAGQPISTGNPFWRNNNVVTYPFSISEARKVLEEAGYTWNHEGKLLYPKNMK